MVNTPKAVTPSWAASFVHFIHCHFFGSSCHQLCQWPPRGRRSRRKEKLSNMHALNIQECGPTSKPATLHSPLQRISSEPEPKIPSWSTRIIRQHHIVGPRLLIFEWHLQHIITELSTTKSETLTNISGLEPTSRSTTHPIRIPNAKIILNHRHHPTTSRCRARASNHFWMAVPITITYQGIINRKVRTNNSGLNPTTPSTTNTWRKQQITTPDTIQHELCQLWRKNRTKFGEPIRKSIAKVVRQFIMRFASL